MAFLTVKAILTFFGGGIAGACFTQLCSLYRNRVQKMKCYYLEDDVQFKITCKIGDMSYGNMHLKKFKITNTTNKDIDKFSVRFVFDLQSVIIDYSSHSKAGYTKVAPKEDKPNECILRVNDFNRGDNVDVAIRIGNIGNNNYYITELESTGFRMKCIDKRKKFRKTKSTFSETLR